jgi:hypothetical protein
MMADMTWKHAEPTFLAFDRLMYVSNKFYEILTETPAEHVVQSTNEDGSDGVPYKPQSFPIGVWTVREPLMRNSPFTAPYFIPTDAHQWVDAWELDEHQLYKCPTGKQVMDWGYGIHHSIIDYTFGCLRVSSVDDLLFLVSSIHNRIALGRRVQFEVIG